jgi:xanthine dehydrogenase accessory factor
MNQDVFTGVSEAMARGERVALVTVVRTQGSTPQRVGAKMLVFADGRTMGTIGGGCYEADACLRARQALDSHKAALARYDLTDDVAADTGLICGGQMEVFIEPIEPAPRLYIVGAGHVGYHLAHLAARVGFQLHVVDDREKFANAERFPDAAELIVDNIADWLHRADVPQSASAVIVTRGHRYDLDALRALAVRDLRYLGLIGSRAKVARLFDELLAEGLPPECLGRVHAPIGLDIGAVTPQEIAVSIVAELIAIKYGRLDPERDDQAGIVASMRWKPRRLSRP